MRALGRAKAARTLQRRQQRGKLRLDYIHLPRASTAVTGCSLACRTLAVWHGGKGTFTPSFGHEVLCCLADLNDTKCKVH